MKLQEAKDMLLKCSKCLYLELPAVIADDVKRHVNNYIKASEDVESLIEELEGTTKQSHNLINEIVYENPGIKQKAYDIDEKLISALTKIKEWRGE